MSVQTASYSRQLTSTGNHNSSVSSLACRHLISLPTYVWRTLSKVNEVVQGEFIAQPITNNIFSGLSYLQEQNFLCIQSLFNSKTEDLKRAESELIAGIIRKSIEKHAPLRRLVKNEMNQNLKKAEDTSTNDILANSLTSLSSTLLSIRIEDSSNQESGVEEISQEVVDQFIEIFTPILQHHFNDAASKISIATAKWGVKSFVVRPLTQYVFVQGFELASGGYISPISSTTKLAITSVSIGAAIIPAGYQLIKTYCTRPQEDVRKQEIEAQLQVIFLELSQSSLSRYNVSDAAINKLIQALSMQLAEYLMTNKDEIFCRAFIESLRIRDCMLNATV